MVPLKSARATFLSSSTKAGAPLATSAEELSRRQEVSPQQTLEVSLSRSLLRDGHFTIQTSFCKVTNPCAKLLKAPEDDCVGSRDIKWSYCL